MPTLYKMTWYFTVLFFIYFCSMYTQHSAYFIYCVQLLQLYVYGCYREAHIKHSTFIHSTTNRSYEYLSSVYSIITRKKIKYGGKRPLKVYFTCVWNCTGVCMRVNMYRNCRVFLKCLYTQTNTYIHTLYITLRVWVFVYFCEMIEKWKRRRREEKKIEKENVLSHIWKCGCFCRKHKLMQ